MRTPSVVVVGSPNAGKSTLINRLSGTRTAVVHEEPGVTRDRKEIDLEWRGRRLVLVDTGGYDTEPDRPFAGEVREQVRAAIDDADLVLFVVDGRAGLLADDHEIANLLRRCDAPVVLVANKVDDPAREALPGELYGLGFGEPSVVSAAHGLGTGDLLDRVLDELEERGVLEEAGGGEATDDTVPVAIVGRPNAGKSSLFNAIAGQPRAIVSELAGTTRDAIDTVVETAHGGFRFIDTAGMRKSSKVQGVEYYAYLRSLQGLERAHVAVVVLDATLGLTEIDLSVASEAMRRGCATVLAVNKSDLVEPDLDELGGIAARKLRQKPLVLAVSARTGRGVEHLLAVVASLDARYTAHIATGELNRALAVLAADRPLPARGSRRLKMYYIAQYQTAPPRFAIDVNDRTLVTRDFGYFVENRLRRRFSLEGVPLIIDFKGRHGR
ncbi:MAG: ribosome biogenesis GTPase Der [Thermoleophilia bacterium]|nr:ribosome biogenesis GTPase Der [Thermoleophilia bacterium]